ncbi:hypothetical protein ACE7GA_00815 [Roseomonas sp. CCTCC AB2023176]|uniref:hypothetical protein n=1 Tax=Roseomonas sp. CCTCC AB2023176 TaxID=3342640 RepID=UPI0035DAB518
MITTVGRYALAFADQGLTALLSLVVALSLIRLGTEEAFGAWVFWSNAVLVLGTAAAALTTVHLHRLPAGPAGRGGTERAILSAGSALVVLAAILTAVAVLSLRPPLSIPEAIVFVPGTLLGLQARVLAASRGRLGWAAVVSTVVFAATVIGLAVGYAAGVGVTAGEVMLFQGIAQGLAGAWTQHRLARGSWARADRSTRRRWRVLLRRSPWPLIGGMAGEVSTRLHIFLVPAMAGTSALAAVAAAQTLLRPATLLAGSWAAAARVTLASARGRGDGRAFLRIVAIGALAPAAATFALGCLVAAAWPFVSRHVYGGRFPGLEWTVLLWTANMAVSCLVLAGGVTAQALGRLRASAWADIAAAAVCAIAMPALLLTLPPGSAPGAMLLGGLVQVAVQWRVLRPALPGPSRRR